MKRYRYKALSSLFCTYRIFIQRYSTQNSYTVYSTFIQHFFPFRLNCAQMQHCACCPTISFDWKSTDVHNQIAYVFFRMCVCAFIWNSVEVGVDFIRNRPRKIVSIHNRHHRFILCLRFFLSHCRMNFFFAFAILVLLMLFLLVFVLLLAILSFHWHKNTYNFTFFRNVAGCYCAKTPQNTWICIG